MERPPENDDPPRPWQYSLRTLFLFVTAWCLVWGWLVTVPAPWNWEGILFFALIGGHVLGNYLGTTLRNRSDEELARQTPNRPDGENSPEPPRMPEPPTKGGPPALSQ